MKNDARFRRSWSLHKILHTLNGPNYSYGLGPDTTFCEGDTLKLLTINFNGGISWLWQDGSSNSYYDVTQTGTYWVKVTYSNDCFFSDTINITQRPKPNVVATSNSPVCTGDTLKLFGNGGDSYTWTGPNGFSASLKDPVVLNASPTNSGNYILTATQDNCNSVPDTAIVQIASTWSPTISITCSANPVCSGMAVSFAATPNNGGTNPSYHWKVNGMIVGTNNPNYSYVPINGDIIICELTSNATCAIGSLASSNPINMTVNATLPVGVSITASENPVCSGTSVTFIATAVNGGSVPSYQWKVNGSNVGTDNPIYSYVPVNGDIITCELTSNATCATGSPSTSSPITMTVYATLPVGVSITASENPVCSGTSVTFTASPVNGGSVPSYQWKVNGSNVGTDNPIYSYVPANSDVVTCLLTSNATCATGSPTTSNPITMIVNATLPVGVSITASENPVCSGASVTFTATPVNGGSVPSYQWKVNGGNVGTDKSYFSYNPANDDQVTCILTSNADCITGSPAVSNTIIMEVNATLPVSVSITASENPVCTGASVTFNAFPTNGGLTPGFQWMINAVTIPGATSSSFISSTLADEDQITCRLTSSASCVSEVFVTSLPIIMNVSPLLPVSISITASVNPVCSATNVTLVATTANVGPSPVYQWTINGINTGTNSQTLTYMPQDNDIVACTLTSNAPCVTGNPAQSNVIAMIVYPSMPVNIQINALPIGPVCEGNVVSFSATTTNSGSNPEYQWMVNGVHVGSNSSSYAYPPTDNDLINCTLVSNETCATGNPATSNILEMDVIQTLNASISIAASVNPLCNGLPVLCTAFPVNGGLSPSYQWKINGTNTGTNSPTYSYVPSDGDEVTCTLTANGQCITGNPAVSSELVIFVKDSPHASLNICSSLTTRDTRPFVLKGGLPLGGIYAGTGVQGILFNPALVPGSQTSTTITYISTNHYNCSDTASQQIAILSENSSFQCGQTFTDIRDNQIYTTQLIGTQCWMKRNLNYGSFISSLQIQEDNCLPEKYCYFNNTNNCLVNGGLYQWDEMMQYTSAEPIQGLCPPSWHIPTETEWSTLINAMNGPGSAGDSLKINGNSGFDAFLSGLIYQSNSWNYDSFTTFYWTSTPVGSMKSLSHGLNIYTGSISRYASVKSNAFSIRCLKD